MQEEVFSFVRRVKDLKKQSIYFLLDKTPCIQMYGAGFKKSVTMNWTKNEMCQDIVLSLNRLTQFSFFFADAKPNEVSIFASRQTS